MRTCTYGECKKQHDARGYCNSHYMLWYRGRLGIEEIKSSCKVCGVELKKAKYCRKHWEKYIYHKSRPLYSTWSAIKQRCYNPKSGAYRHYGERGITMYSKWIDDYDAFEEYMGEKPSPKHSIDRIDVNGNYEPGNLRWATMTEQNRNRRVDNKSGYTGVTWCAPRNKWTAHISLNYKTIHLGYFINKEDAAKARKEAEAKYWT